MDGGSVIKDVLAGAGQTRFVAETLPPAAYVSEAFYEREADAVFRSDWVCVGHISALPEVGSYTCVNLLGEPLVIVRGEDKIRALSSVCRHRWAPVVSGSGKTRVFSCPFHKWAYGLDGSLLAAPFMEGAEGFDAKKCALPEVRCEVVEDLGLVFVTFSQTIGSITERLADLRGRVRRWRMGDLTTVHAFDMDSAFNWKIQVETFMECYHHIGAHPTTFEVEQPARLSSCEDGKTGWSLCLSPYRPDAPFEARTLGLPLCPDLSEEDCAAVHYVNIFPNATLAFRPDSVALVTVFPDGPKRTRSTRITLARPEAAADKEALELTLAKRAEFSRQVTAEDNAVNEMQQAGAASRLATPGRLSQLEITVWDLANYVRGRLQTNG